MAQGGSVLRTLLALGASFALAACASSQRAEEGATPAIGQSAMEAAAAEKTGGAVVVAAPAKPKPVAATPEPEKPAAAPAEAGKAEPKGEAGPAVAKIDAVTVAAAAPPPPPPADAQPKNVNLTRGRPAEIPTPKQLIGLNRDEVHALLGFPWLLKREGTAELWQYRVTSCVLDLFLLGPDPGDLKVSHVELRSRRENRPPTAACYVDILNTPRPAPNQTAKGGPNQPSS